MNNIINQWLERFRENWISKNIDAVLDLFSKDVVYFETPFNILAFEDLRKEWLSVLDQNNINLNFSVWNKENNKYTVRWELSYSDTKNISFNFRGVYLISLNNDGLCNEFIQYGEQEIN